MKISPLLLKITLIGIACMQTPGAFAQTPGRARAMEAAPTESTAPGEASTGRRSGREHLEGVEGTGARRTGTPEELARAGGRHEGREGGHEGRAAQRRVIEESAGDISATDAVSRDRALESRESAEGAEGRVSDAAVDRASLRRIRERFGDEVARDADMVDGRTNRSSNRAEDAVREQLVEAGRNPEFTPEDARNLLDLEQAMGESPLTSNVDRLSDCLRSQPAKGMISMIKDGLRAMRESPAFAEAMRARTREAREAGRRTALEMRERADMARGRMYNLGRALREFMEARFLSQGRPAAEARELAKDQFDASTNERMCGAFNSNLNTANAGRAP